MAYLLQTKQSRKSNLELLHMFIFVENKFRSFYHGHVLWTVQFFTTLCN
jgi:hypothetical protein